MNETVIETIAPATRWALPVIVSVVLLGLAVIFMAWRNARFVRFRRRRWFLVSLRALTVILFLLIFLEPILRERRIRRVRNHVAVLLDTSISMQTPTKKGTRMDEVHAFFEGWGPELDVLGQDHSIHWYTFGTSLDPVKREEVTQAKEGTQTGTRLLEALSDLSRLMRGKELAGVVVVSDGVDNGVLDQLQRGQSAPVGEVHETLKRVNAPVHYVQIGRNPSFSDLRVAEIHAPGFTFVMNAASLDAVIDVQGELPPVLEVSLYEDSQPSRTEKLPTVPGKRRYRVTLPFLPRRVGDHIYTVRVAPGSSDQYLANNERSVLVPAIRDRIRVLQVAGHPSFDVRFLRDHLKSNPNVDLVSFFILIDRSDVRVNADETSLIPFPVQELFEQELPGFDLVIFQDFEYGPFGVGQYLPHVKTFVENGGALAVLGGGRSFEKGHYHGTKLEEILPVKLNATGTASPDRGGGFRARITEEGYTHPLLRLLPDPTENRLLLSRMPLLYGANRVHGLREDALALIVHPELRDRTGNPLPIISLREVGKGRTMAITTDSLWRWNFVHSGKGGDAYPYNRFWTASIDWLMRDAEMNPLRLVVEPPSVYDGEPITAHLTVASPSYKPASSHPFVLELSRVDALVKKTQDQVVMRFDDRKSGKDGLVEVSFTPPGPGVYRLSASARFGDKVLQTSRLLVVDPGTEELVRVYDPEDLFGLVAKASGGKTYDATRDLQGMELKKPETLLVSRERERPIWSHAGVLFLAVFLLAMEWAFRKRFGLP